MEADLLLAVVIVTALAFDFTNGFHDTANAMATSIATRALKPRAAVGLSAVLNFAGGGVILASSYYGFPLSTTHVTSGAVIGSGLGKRLADVRWGLAARMVTAWLVTLPAAGAVAALAFELSEAIGAGVGALLVGLVGVAIAAGLYALTQRRDPVTAETV
jgi:phosphate/sulfate permease